MQLAIDENDFVLLGSSPTSLVQWNNLVERGIGSLASIAQMAHGRKYYYYEPDGKFYESRLVPARFNPLRYIIGEWGAEFVGRKEEGLFRQLFKLSIDDTVLGLQKVRGVVAIIFQAAKTFLDKASRRRLTFLQGRINTIKEKLKEVDSGLMRLSVTYFPEKEKQSKLERPILFLFHLEADCKALEENIKKRRALLVSDGKDDAELDSLLPKNDRLIPFPGPHANAEQILFNLTFAANLKAVSEYVRASFKAIHAAPSKVYKPLETRMPWRIAVTKSKSIYFHYGVAIDDDKGAYKRAKAAYSVALGETVAKLSSTFEISDNSSNKQIAEREEEFLLLCRQKNMPNVVRVYEVIWCDKITKLNKHVRRQIIYEQFCANGPLFLSQARLANDPDKIRDILLGIICGVAALHSEGIVHGDLKDNNVFLDTKDVPYIGDFGFATYEGESIDRARFSPLFTDPDCVREYYETSWVKKRCYHDIWSLGVIMYHYLFNVQMAPWFEGATLQNFHQVTRQRINSVFPEPPEDDLFKHACWRMLRLDPHQRPTAMQLLYELSPPGYIDAFFQTRSNYQTDAVALNMEP